MNSAETLRRSYDSTDSLTSFESSDDEKITTTKICCSSSGKRRADDVEAPSSSSKRACITLNMDYDDVLDIVDYMFADDIFGFDKEGVEKKIGDVLHDEVNVLEVTAILSNLFHEPKESFTANMDMMNKESSRSSALLMTS